MPTDFVSKAMRLPARERLALAERLWISVADERRMSVPEEHKHILRKRMADYRAGRTSAIPHDELMRRLRAS
jgi:putative addiction module component (TIGR02574 family)